jgi:hypothetical protein
LKLGSLLPSSSYILGGIGLGILTGGGSLIGMGLHSAALGGLGHLQNKIFGVGKALPKLSGGNFDIDTSRWQNANNFQGEFSARSLGKHAPISSGMLGNIPKINIPELGGLQSPQHFNMPWWVLGTSAPLKKNQTTNWPHKLKRSFIPENFSECIIE